MANIQLDGIMKRYPNGFVAVNNFNLDIEDKEFIILVGPSGCGKSTMLRMIAGLEEISGGSFLMDGRRMNSVAPKNRDLAMVFQNYSLYPHMTVYQNMAFGLKMRHYPKMEIDKRVRETAKLLEIENLLSNKPKLLSGGQCQRVAMGRAIVREPKAFLMDEPLSNLDAKLRGQMRTLISRLHQRLQTTFIYVTHDQVEAMTLGTRIVVMKDGFIQQVDTPRNLYDKPNNVFVAGFIGSPPMNFIRADVVRQDGSTLLKFSNFHLKLNAHQSQELRGGSEKIIIGIRPEDLSLGGTFVKTNDKSMISAAVDLVEPLGSETLLHLDIAGTNIVLRTAPDITIKVGETTALMINTDRIHVFDAETEALIF